MEKDKTVRLTVGDPDMRNRGSEFAVEFGGELSEEYYKLIRQNIEFRKRCMIQGFDNLLELLDMHWQACRSMDERDAQENEAKSGGA